MRQIKFRAWNGSGKYVAGSDGLIYSKDFNHSGDTKALKPQIDKHGYYCVVLYVDEGRIFRGVAKLVALAFIGERPQGLVINHINGIRTDNRPENLEYITSSENAIHGFKLGRVISNEIKEAKRKEMVLMNHNRWHGNKECVCVL